MGLDFLWVLGGLLGMNTGVCVCVV